MPDGSKAEQQERRLHMYQVGEWIYYGNVGACQVVGIRKMKIPGMDREQKILSEVRALPGVHGMLNLKANKKYKINVQFKLA